jgi:hypothetical protein
VVECPRPCPLGAFLVYNARMVDSFSEFEASSLFCPRCKRATPVRKKLLLVLPSGNKYDYTCSECGTQVGGKTDSDSSDFHRVASASRTPPPARPGRPPFRLS